MAKRKGKRRSGGKGRNPHALRGASSEKGSRRWYVGGFQA